MAPWTLLGVTPAYGVQTLDTLVHSNGGCCVFTGSIEYRGQKGGFHMDNLRFSDGGNKKQCSMYTSTGSAWYDSVTEWLKYTVRLSPILTPTPLLTPTSNPIILEYSPENSHEEIQEHSRGPSMGEILRENYRNEKMLHEDSDRQRFC